MGNIWIGLWASFPHFMDPTLQLQLTQREKIRTVFCQGKNYKLNSLPEPPHAQIINGLFLKLKYHQWVQYEEIVVFCTGENVLISNSFA